MGPQRNLAVLRGTVRNEPVVRDLKGGTTVLQFDLATPVDDATQSVPIAWHDPTSTQLATVVDGTELLVIGSVQRRFFRVGAQTQSRTEVIASTVVPARRAKSVRSAIGAAVESLSGTG